MKFKVQLTRPDGSTIHGRARTDVAWCGALEVDVELFEAAKAEMIRDREILTEFAKKL